MRVKKEIGLKMFLDLLGVVGVNGGFIFVDDVVYGFYFFVWINIVEEICRNLYFYFLCNNLSNLYDICGLIYF